MESYDIHLNAYVKLALHSFKHKDYAVNGILIGRVSDAKVEIIDAVPLFHSDHTSQSPATGIDETNILGEPQRPLNKAIRKIKKYYKDEAELSIVGYFHGNGLLDCDGFELNSGAIEIADHISKDYHIACILMLDYNKLKLLSNWEDVKFDEAPIMELYTKNETSAWEKSSVELTLMEPSSANGVLQDFIYSGKEDDVFDFDDHLIDDNNEWRNSQLLHGIILR